MPFPPYMYILIHTPESAIIGACFRQQYHTKTFSS